MFTHHPDKHDEWAARKATYKNHRKKNKADTQPTNESKAGNGTDSTNNKLILKDSMKTALLSHFEISEEQANEILKQAHENSDFQ